jgi:hypothetical protein
VKQTYARQAKWALGISLVTIVPVIWQFADGTYDENIFVEGNWVAMALIATCALAWWYASWSFAYAKGYPVIGIFLPFLSLFGLALLFFLKDQDSMVAEPPEGAGMTPAPPGE